MGEWDFVADAVTAYDNAPKTKKVPFDHHKFYAEEQVHLAGNPDRHRPGGHPLGRGVSVAHRMRVTPRRR